MTAIENAHKRRKWLLEELRRVNEFLAAHSAFSQDRLPPLEPKKQFNRGVPAAIRAVVVDILREAAEPMRPAEIAKRVSEKGVAIPSLKPAAYISVIAHRNQDIIARLPSGYWLHDMPEPRP